MEEKEPLISHTSQGEVRPRISKDGFGKRLVIATLLLIAALVHLWNIRRLWSPLHKETAHERAVRILKTHPLIDGHNDLLIHIRGSSGNKINSPQFRTPFESGNYSGQVDIPRLTQSHSGGAFWSTWLPCPTENNNYSDATYDPFVKGTLEQIDLFSRLSYRYPKYFSIPRSAAEAKENFYKHNKLISPLIIEGLHQIGNSLSTLRLYHLLGVRYATLNWNCHTKYSDAAVVKDDQGRYVASKPLHGGVSNPDGRTVIREMNRMGMIVDLAHVSEDTMRDVLVGRDAWEGSIAPPIFSHSSAKAICPHPRNVPDDVLRLVKKRNSVVMVNFAPDFISCKDTGSDTGIPEFVEETNDIDQIVKHIVHIGELIGYDHVGLGSDFDGIASGPRGMEDVSKYPDLVAKLLERGISEKNIIKIIGGNILRVWEEVDKVAAKLQKKMEPIEDDSQKHVPGFPGEL